MKSLLLLSLLLSGAVVATDSPKQNAIVITETAELPTLDQFVFADTKLPANVVCVDGKCSIVRRYEPAANVAADDGGTCESSHRFNGPIANSSRAVAGVARRVAGAVAYRVTHPFRGRFRR